MIAIGKAKRKFWTCTANPLLLILMDLERKIKDEVEEEEVYVRDGAKCIHSEKPGVIAMTHQAA